MQQRADQGYEPFFLSFMFDHIPGSAVQVQKIMEQTVEGVYGRMLTRLFRYPNSAANRHCQPLWIICPDYPVPKAWKHSLRDVAVNSGRHLQGTAMIPPNTRLRDRFHLHVLAHSEVYVQSPLHRLDVQPIRERLAYMSGDYGFKSLLRGRTDWDELIVLPRIQSEMPRRQDRWLDQAMDA